MKPGWQIRPLGEVVKLNYGKAIAKEVRGPVGPVPVYGANGIMDYCEDALGDGPSIIVGRKGSAGAINVADGPFWASDVSYFTRHDPQKIDFSYLLYFLRQLDLPSLAKGVKPGINRDEVYALPIPLPPLDEQRRIVAVLDEAFEGLSRARANTEANLADARELFESFVSRIFDDPPSDWRERSLGSLCRKITVGHVGPMADRYVEEGIPFLRSQNIRPFRVDRAGLKYIDAGFMAELSKSELRPGDVAIVRTGYPGTCAVIPDDLQIANCADLVIARPGPELDPHFIALLLNSRFGKAHVADVSVGAAQKHFNVAAAKAAVFPIPPISVQQDLVERARSVMADIDEMSAVLEEKEKALDTLRQSLLQKAFAGELT